MTGYQEVNVSVLVRNKDDYPVVEDTMTTVLYVRTYTAHVIQYNLNSLR